MLTPKNEKAGLQPSELVHCTVPYTVYKVTGTIAKTTKQTTVLYSNNTRKASLNQVAQSEELEKEPPLIEIYAILSIALPRGTHSFPNTATTSIYLSCIDILLGTFGQNEFNSLRFESISTS